MFSKYFSSEIETNRKTSNFLSNRGRDRQYIKRICDFGDFVIYYCFSGPLQAEVNKSCIFPFQFNDVKAYGCLIYWFSEMVF